MAADSDLLKFVDAARTQGASDDSLVYLLRGRGWPAEDVYRALGTHYEKTSGLHIPGYRRAGAAKDAFLYLLAFSTLGTWTIGLGSLMFTLIDRWISDPLSVSAFSDSYSIASSMASLLVAFPIYLFIMHLIISEVEKHPEKLDDGVRKWLTYIALFIAAGVVIGDLVTTLTVFLRGELTARFVAKAATVIVISGGVFWYYLGSLKKTPEAAHAVKQG
jgi:hypothetical protein